MTIKAVTFNGKCRPRRDQPDDCPYPFTGDDGDADAMRILLAVQKRILDAAKARPQQPLGEFMAREDIEALTLLNHMTAYLDNREEYAKMRPSLYGYLVID